MVVANFLDALLPHLDGLLRVLVRALLVVQEVQVPAQDERAHEHHDDHHQGDTVAQAICRTNCISMV